MPLVKGIKAVYACVFIDSLGLGIVIPVLPYYALEFGANGFMLGVVLSAFSAAQIFGSYAMGRVSDMIGRRRVLIFSLFGSGAAFLAIGLVGNITQLIIVRALSGIVSGSIPVAQAYIADMTTTKERPLYLGLIGATIGTAFTIGPALGALLFVVFDSPELPFFVASGFSFLSFLYAAKYLQESERVADDGSDSPAVEEGGEKTAADQEYTGIEVEDVSGDGKDNDVAQAVGKTTPTSTVAQPVPAALSLCAIFLHDYGFQVMTSMYALLILQYFNWGTLELGFILMGSGVITILVQGVLVRKLMLTYKVGPHMMVLQGLVIYTIGMFLYPVATADAVLHLTLFGIFIAGYSLANSNLSALVSIYATADTQGKALGRASTVKAISRVVSPVVSGRLYDYSNSPNVQKDISTWLAGGTFPFIVAAFAGMLSLVAVLVLTAGYYQPKQEEEEGAVVMGNEKPALNDEEQLMSISAQDPPADQSVDPDGIQLHLRVVPDEAVTEPTPE